MKNIKEIYERFFISDLCEDISNEYPYHVTEALIKAIKNNSFHDIDKREVLINMIKRELF